MLQDYIRDELEQIRATAPSNGYDLETITNDDYLAHMFMSSFSHVVSPKEQIGEHPAEEDGPHDEV